MKDIWLFIHGGWGGSWQWTPVISLMEKRGIESIAPDLPGMGKNNSNKTTLDDHLSFVEEIMESINSPVYMTAFSFGGLLATAYAGKYPEKIKKIIYIDAFLPKPGQAFSDIAGKRISDQIERFSDNSGNNNMIPPLFDADKRYCDHPLDTLYSKVSYDLEALTELDPVYIECTNKDPKWTFTPILQKASRWTLENNWKHYKINSDHMPMYSHTEELSRLLIG